MAMGEGLSAMPGKVAGGPAYEDALETGAVLRRRDRRFLGVEGKAPEQMLKGILSGRIPAPLTEAEEGWSEGDAPYSTILTPKGKMVTDLRLLPSLGNGFLLDLPEAGWESTLGHLKKYLHPRFAHTTDRSDELGMLTVVGPEGPACLSKVLGSRIDALGRDGLRFRSGGGESDLWILGNAEVHPPAIDLILSLDLLEEVRGRLQEGGTRPLDSDSWDTLRIESGTPLFGVDMTEETLPVEAGIEHRAIDYEKGCYTGQEVIIRIRHRGHVNKHLRGILLGEAEVPEGGTELYFFRGAAGAPSGAGSESPGGEGWRKIGRITSACRSPRFGQTIALGFVKREVEPGGEVRLGGPQGSPGSVRVLDEDWMGRS